MTDDECCGRPMVVDNETRGTTCGGLSVVGGLRCTICGSFLVAKGVTREAKADDDASTWSIAGSGRSLNCGGLRLRVDGKAKADDIEQLMLRLVQLPTLEAEVVQLRAALAAAEGCGRHVATAETA